jgi:hypothetical protein
MGQREAQQALVLKPAAEAALKFSKVGHNR